MKSLQFPSVCMNANRSRGCRNNHPSPSDAIACQGEDGIATACPGKAGIVREQEFPAWASRGSIEELHLPFTAQDKVLLVKNNWNGRKFQSKHGKEELCWEALNGKGRGNNEQQSSRNKRVNSAPAEFHQWDKAKWLGFVLNCLVSNHRAVTLKPSPTWNKFEFIKPLTKKKSKPKQRKNLPRRDPGSQTELLMITNSVQHRGWVVKGGYQNQWIQTTLNTRLDTVMTRAVCSTQGWSFNEIFFTRQTCYA